MKYLALLAATISVLLSGQAQAARIGTDVYGLFNNAANVYYQDVYQKKHHYRAGIVTVNGNIGLSGYYRGLLPKSGDFKPYWELGIGIGSTTAVLASLGLTLDVATDVSVEPYLGVSAPGTTGLGINLAYRLH